MASDLIAAPSPPYFMYIITPQQVATSDNDNNPVTLYVGINNPANGFVPCQYIKLAIHIGTNQNDLTDDWHVQGQQFQPSWTIQSMDYVGSPLVFQILPAPGITGLEAGESIGFELTGININNAPGPARVGIQEATDDPPGATEILINKVPASLQITLFQADPPLMPPGGQSVLSWATTGASQCTIVPPLTQSVCPNVVPPDPLPTTGEIDICPKQTTPYTLTAYAGGGGYIVRSFNVGIEAAISSFTATPQQFVRGEQVTLAWATQAATAWSIDQGVGPIEQASQGSVPVWPQTQTKYTLTASGIGPDAQATATATPQPQGWTTGAAPPFTPGVLGNNLVMLAYDDKLWLIDTAGILVFSSIDGQTWTKVDVTTPWTSRTGCAAVVYDDLIWLIFGAAVAYPPVAEKDFWASKDGATWSQYTPSYTPSAVGFLPRVGLSAVVFQDRIWAFGGGQLPMAPCYRDVWSSGDGMTWKQEVAQAPWSNWWYCTAAVFNNQIWICAQTNDGVHPTSEAWYSNDGVNWQQWNNGATPPWNSYMSAAQVLNGQLCLTTMDSLWFMDANENWSQSSWGPPWKSLLQVAAQVYNWRLCVAANIPQGQNIQPGVWVYTP